MNHRVRVYPHNDLLNLVHHQREIINNKKSEGIEDGVALDCLGCLISLAFSVEALVNFIGHKKINNWKERRPYMDKLNQVCIRAGLAFNKSKEPFNTLLQLKELRDSIAHGKPIEITTSVHSRAELRREMECPWDQNLTSEYVNNAYEIVKQFERDLFENCQITVGQTLTAVGCGV
ncbi:MAG: hypothetical protein DRQ64_09600 [Gammaproteobacteria bacterium]|nr:MAG: hypothetical protein DRQ64_09600 [Gammaproteobacteria bacterium]